MGLAEDIIVIGNKRQQEINDEGGGSGGIADGPDIVVVGAKSTRTPIWSGSAYDALFGMQAISNGGSTSAGAGFRTPQNVEDKACRILQDKSKSSSGTLPGYLTGNKNWNNSSTLRGYQNYYQSNADQWKAANGRVAGYALVGLGMIPIVRGGEWAVRAGGFATGAAGWELGNFMQNQQRMNENKVSAIQDRLNVLEAGCGGK